MPSRRACWFAVCLVVAVAVSIPASLSAQGTSGRVVGRVADPGGAVLANVKVTLVNEGTSVSRNTKTNENGDYDFVEVPVGTYRLEFDLTGFKKNVRRGVQRRVESARPWELRARGRHPHSGVSEELREPDRFHESRLAARVRPRDDHQRPLRGDAEIARHGRRVLE